MDLDEGDLETRCRESWVLPREIFQGEGCRDSYCDFASRNRSIVMRSWVCFTDKGGLGCFFVKFGEVGDVETLIVS